MRFATSLGGLAIVLIFVAACGDVEPTTTGTVSSPGASSQTQQTPTPTPTPQLPGSITPAPASEGHRLDLGDGVVVAFVEGLSPAYEGKVAYATHVPSGSQLVLNRDGHTIDQHDGRGDGPGRLDAVLADEPTMDRIMEVLQSDEDAKPRDMHILWIHSIRFGGIEYVARWRVIEPGTISILSELTEEHLGPEVYRVAFRRDGYVGLGYRYQDGDATYLNPGTPVYAVKGYSPEFWLATLDDGTVRLFEADTNPRSVRSGNVPGGSSIEELDPNRPTPRVVTSTAQVVELTAIDTHYDNNSISLWWEDPDWDVDYWVVERSTTQDGPWETIAAKRPGELRPQEEPPHAYDRWADGKLPPGDRYYYRIYSCTESGRSGYSNVVSGVVPEFMPGLPPPIEAKEAVDPPC